MTPVALRFAWRELRGGLSGFRVFVACIALGVMAIAGVGSVAQSLAEGLSRAGGVILGGDLAFSLVQREANESERHRRRCRHASDHGARRRWTNDAGRGQSGRRRLSAGGDGRDRS
jgi:putative ABC transport system permease protein